MGKIEQLVNKYYQHYRQMIIDGMGNSAVKGIGNPNDYSHPFKIYCTLLSVLMVMQTDYANTTKNTQNAYKYPVTELLDWK